MNEELIALIGHLEHDAVNKVLFGYPYSFASGITLYCDLCKKSVPLGTSSECYLGACWIGKSWQGMICTRCKEVLRPHAKINWSSARDHDGNRTRDDQGRPIGSALNR